MGPRSTGSTLTWSSAGQALPRSIPRPSLLRLPGCYQARADTWLLADTLRHLKLARGATVLDLCTGTGALAVAAGLDGARDVTATDISNRATTNAWINGRRHRIPVRVLRGDLYSALRPDEEFDVVVSNPPYIPSRTRRLSGHAESRCWDAGPGGRQLLDRICDETFAWLRPGGSLLLVHSTVSDEGRSVERLTASGLVVDIVRREREPFGPVMRARSEMLRNRGLIVEGQDDEELVVIRGTKSVRAWLTTRNRSRVETST
ncbi:HemK2/MTQ2 family protein methyltransferase [Knoellia sp. S7-12]|uniref:HemK2/MTQ2 family protein methyltransferase n=1 Tax=Knoellia sp. S7-12 TaxID=3126698 RepID=UPI003366BE96